jgi:hypothetical protein
MGSVLVITGGYSVEHATKDLPVVHELRRRGHRVSHVVVGRDVPPPYPRSLVEHDAEFQAASSRWVDWVEDTIPALGDCDVLLVPIYKGVKQIVEWAHRLGKLAVQHDNHGGYDSYYYGADLVAVKGPFFADFVRRRFGLAEDQVVVTGTVQLDRAFSPRVRGMTRQDFCQLYRLDPARRIAVWLPTREDRQHNYYEWSRNQYERICETVIRSSNHSLIIKPHPGDYRSPDSPTAGDPPWWQTLFPQAAVCQPEHGYECFWNCDVGIANWSSTGLEFPVFRRPFVYVDVVDNPRMIDLKVRIKVDHPIGFDRGAPVPGFVGRVCTLADLPGLLETLGYEALDPALYDQHVARFLHRADGLAYRRVADLVERALALATARPVGRSQIALARLYLQRWAGTLRRSVGRSYG